MLDANPQPAGAERLTGCGFVVIRPDGQPDQPRQYLLLSDILTKMGRTEEAIKEPEDVEELEMEF